MTQEISPTKTRTLLLLGECGVTFRGVIDVGVKEETSVLIDLYPDLKHWLFEPVEEFFPAIERNYAEVEHELVPVAVSDSSGWSWLQLASLAGGDVSHSNLVDRESSSHEDRLRQVRTTTLDDWARSLQPSTLSDLLLKVDVDGAELRILKGAAEFMRSSVTCVVVEAERPQLPAIAHELSLAGFALFDVVDLCYYRGHLHQCDLVFLSREIYGRPELDPWQKGPFDPTAWIELGR